MLKWIGLKDLKIKWTDIQNIRARDDQKKKKPERNCKDTAKKHQRNRKETAKKPQRNHKDIAKKTLDRLEMIESNRKLMIIG